MKPLRIKPGPGQESVWDYHRPPRLEAFSGHIKVILNGVTIADTRGAMRVLETSHPPVYYTPLWIFTVNIYFNVREPHIVSGRG